jgi:hypothetical protein
MYLAQIDKTGKLGPAKHYGWPSYNEGLFIHPLKAGYLLTGYSTGIGKGGADAVFIKLDQDLNKVWEKPWGGELADYVLDIRPEGDGFIIAGVTKSFGDRDGDGFFARLDQDANVTGLKTYGLPGWPDEVRGIAPTDGGYLFAFNTQNFGDQSQNVWMLKVDQNGDCKIKGCPGVK